MSKWKYHREEDAEAAKLGEALTCFCCQNEFVGGAIHRHHFPVSDKNGGEFIVPVCSGCHTLIHSVPLHKWPLDWITTVLTSTTRAHRLLLMKLVAVDQWREQKKGNRDLVLLEDSI